MARRSYLGHKNVRRKEVVTNDIKENKHEKCAEENTWTEEGCSNGRLQETA
jgi:hypothetical protein